MIGFVANWRRWPFIVYWNNGRDLRPLFGFDPRFVTRFHWDSASQKWWVRRRERALLRWLRLARLRRCLRRGAA